MPSCPPIDVIQTALSRLLSQFDGSSNLRALLAVLAEPFQAIEDDACALVTDATLDMAAGALLDRYGIIVGFPRGGRADDDYRRVLKIVIGSQNASGTVESILTFAAIVAGVEDSVTAAGSGLRLTIQPPAAYLLQLYTPTPLTSAQVADIAAALDNLTAAGVGYDVVEASSATPKTFDYSGLGFDDGLFGSAILTVP